MLELPLMRDRGIPPDAPYAEAIRDALTETLLAAGSDLVIFPLQDVFGWRDRINRPASVGEQNWTWRLPWPVEDLTTTDPESRHRAEFLRRMSAKFGRR